MFIGHHAVAFAAKRIAPRTSLGTLMFAVQFLDVLWPIFLLLGWEHVRIMPGITAVTPLDFYDYPFSHSLVTSLLWAVAFGVIYFAIRRDSRAAFVVGGCTASHWFLDAIVHRPDLPVSVGNTSYIGLGLWNSISGTILLEFGLYILGLIIYLQSTHAVDRRGSYILWGLIIFLPIAYLGNLVSGPPPSVTALAIGAHASWLIPLWGYWADRHRIATGIPTADL